MIAVSPDEWRARGQHFEWRGHRIFHRVEGAGPAVLLVHGFPTASWDWAPLWPQLAARHRVLTLDMLGFGFSSKPRDFAYSVLAQADLFTELLSREGVTSYHLVAHDYGVSVAQELLARQRDAASPSGAAPSAGAASAGAASAGSSSPRIVSVALLNGGLFPEAHRPLLTQKLLASPLGPLIARLGSYRTFASSMRKLWGRHPLADDELRAMWQLVTAGDGTAVLPKLIGYMAERRARRERWVGALLSSDVPVRLINGLIDPISGAHVVERYRELVSRPDVVELPGVGHYPQLEAPGDVLAAILEHLGRAPAPASAPAAAPAAP